ncbi:alpha/beta hydrolase [Shewanella sp. Scap07]|uniref:alpha/beta hydrolase n=1 Tax=Shewanella sp. Scap07 TaxID=2589987 RepID=UPI0015BD2E75|nr:alpha/beta hydrolase [Shewanella sp. Scap07]QLE84493.1 alpha/beta hydrolase [Shewanella sp. Scap07]
MKSTVFSLLPTLALSAAITSSMAVANHDDVPTPVGVSAEFGQILADRAAPVSVPTPQTLQQWQAFQKKFDAPGIALGKALAEKHQVSYEQQQIAGVDTFVVTPKQIAKEHQQRLFVHLHGGAFVFGGQESALREAVWIANGLGVKVVSIDYRKPPLHAHPAALEDSVAVWKALLEAHDPQSMALFGTSAGGNLTLATTLKLQQHDLPLPAALFTGTPATDLAQTTDSWYTLQGLDPLGQRDGLVQGAMDLYAGETPLSDPLLSPVNANIEQFPPTLLISGTRDLLLSDTVRMHRVLRAADVDAQLHIYDGQSHADYLHGAMTPFPESDDAIKELNAFFNLHLK